MDGKERFYLKNQPLEPFRYHSSTVLTSWHESGGAVDDEHSAQLQTLNGLKHPQFLA